MNDLIFNHHEKKMILLATRPRVHISTYVIQTFILLMLTSTLVIQAKNLKNPIECLVCQKIHSNTDHTIIYKGMKIPLCSEGCHDHYQEASNNNTLDTITSKIEPRAALFQEDSQTKYNLSKLFFWIGLYIFIGLVFGGLSAYIAVQKGLTAWSAFLIGLALNILGLIFIVKKPKNETLFHSDGLSKVPVTHSESICRSCGHSNHPSAKKCNNCDNQLASSVTSEVTTI